MGVVVNALRVSLGYELAQIIVFFVILCCLVSFGFGFFVYRDAITKQYRIVASGGETLGLLMIVIGGVMLLISLLLEMLGFLLSQNVN